TGEFYRLKPDFDPATIRSGPADIAAFVDRVKLHAPDGEPLKLELESFISALKGEAPIVVTGEEGRLALGVALRIVKEIELTLPAAPHDPENAGSRRARAGDPDRLSGFQHEGGSRGKERGRARALLRDAAGLGVGRRADSETCRAGYEGGGHSPIRGAASPGTWNRWHVRRTPAARSYSADADAPGGARSTPSAGKRRGARSFSGQQAAGNRSPH